MQLKIGDFGLATKLEFEGDRKRTICGTPNYIAPEILDGKQGHSYEVDMWSFGVIMYTLLIGKPPFEASDVKATYRRIRANAYSFPDRVVISNNAKDLITKILNLDPAKRPSINEIYDHSFFHNGNSIPKLLPASTLACPPSSSYTKQFYGSKVNVEVYTLEKSQEEIFKSVTNRVKDSEKKAKMKEEKIGEGKNVLNLVWVRKWVDFSSKYGLGYFLSNGAFGVFFNDSTKIILDLSGK
jgi:polo-like kinase 1